MNFGITELILVIVVFLVVTTVAAIIFGWILRAFLKKPDFVAKCPFCAETIRPDAKLCRFCGRNLVN